MIAFKNRFHGHGSLRYVYQNGKTIRSTLCSVKYINNPKRTHYRLSVVVSKKISKSAVKRNRIRRRIYEIIRLEEARIKSPYDIVVTVFSEQISNVDFTDLQEAITSQLKQAGVIL